MNFASGTINWARVSLWGLLNAVLVLVTVVIGATAFVAQAKQDFPSGMLVGLQNRSFQTPTNREPTKKDEPKGVLGFDILSGSPQKAGSPFVIRMKLADGGRISPHWHPVDENVTVISGTLYMGKGDKFDESKGEELTTGSFMLMPKEQRHFMWAKGETIVQIHGIGPFKTYWVNASKQQPRR